MVLLSLKLMMVTRSVQLSTAVADPVLDGAVSDSQFKVIFAGHVINGFVESLTVINCIQLLEFPQLSVAVHVLDNI
jgi:hypothetical protein